MSAARILLALVWVLGTAGAATAQTEPAPEPLTFVGAESCKSCHQAIFDSWAQTKHARTINRLNAAQRGQECIACHVTAAPETITAGEIQAVHHNVQCESCHGRGSAHVADPQVRRGLTKKPGESSCTPCHNDKSPHYRGFVYAAMMGFSHKK
jgi:hypothetical protein